MALLNSKRSPAFMLTLLIIRLAWNRECRNLTTLPGIVETQTVSVLGGSTSQSTTKEANSPKLIPPHQVENAESCPNIRRFGLFYQTSFPKIRTCQSHKSK